jgi:translation initiation factor IF-2
LQTTPNEIIRTLIKHSIFANINQVVEYEKAALIAQDLGFEPSQTTATNTSTATNGERQLSASEAMANVRSDEQTISVPPVVTIMGHVDHGKTSLLDTIRKTKVAAGEAGGITQHIGAYQVEVNGKKITFLDTPGHEAFTAMRARGAQVAHIAIIVVAADDGVMPQTREAIDHARAAKMPIIIALNKIDRPNANPDHVKQQLADIGVVVEEYGGDTVCVPISAKKNIGIDDLLDYIVLVAELQDIRANPNRPATGVIIEAKLEKNSGPQATVLVQQGTLKMGDNILVGTTAGKVRAMFNDRGKRIQKAPPSTPVSIMGLPEVPQAGDQLEVVADERTAKQRAQQEAEKRRNESAPLGQVSLDTLYTQMQEGKVKELNVVLKSDVQGSAEAVKNALSKIGEENMKVRLIREGIGNISETDVHLGAASGAIVIGFNVKTDGAAQREAQKEGVEIRYYDVIYKLIDDIQAALAGMLEPTFQEVIEGHAEVIQIFKAGKTLIAGCRITDGKITRSSQARVMRKDEKVYDGKIASLRRGKDDVREVLTGYECGILLEDFNEVEAGDIIEAYAQERVKAGV